MSNLFRPLIALSFASILVAQLPTKDPAPPPKPTPKPESPAPGNEPDENIGNLIAFVSAENGNPLDVATVILEQDEKAIRTGATGESGYLTFVGVKPGRYKAKFLREGYIETSMQVVNVKSASTTEIKAVLVKQK